MNYYRDKKYMSIVYKEMNNEIKNELKKIKQLNNENKQLLKDIDKLRRVKIELDKKMIENQKEMERNLGLIQSLLKLN